MSNQIEGQLNDRERQVLTSVILDSPATPNVVLEIGTWLGGGSTVTFLRALEKRGAGHLWGIEADRSIYQKMIRNIEALAPEACRRFTPLFGFSQQVIPDWLAEQKPDFQIDVAFLDGGNNPLEQVTEFRLVESRIPVGGHLLSHDAKLRKGKWFVPFLSRLDNWETTVHDISVEGLCHARKLAPAPSDESLEAAEKHLFKLRCDAVEILGQIVPRNLIRAGLQMLPERFSRRYAEGRG